MLQLCNCSDVWNRCSRYTSRCSFIVKLYSQNIVILDDLAHAYSWPDFANMSATYTIAAIPCLAIKLQPLIYLVSCTNFLWIVIYTTSDFSVFIDKVEWIFTLASYNYAFNERPWNGIAKLKGMYHLNSKKLLQIVRDFLHLLILKTVDLYSANTIISPVIYQLLFYLYCLLSNHLFWCLLGNFR